MNKQNAKQSATDATSDKIRPNQSLVRLTETQLEAIAGGAGGPGCPIWHCGGNHNETILKEELISKQHRDKITAKTTPAKPCPEKFLVRLTEAQLEAIAGGIDDLDKDEDDGCPRWACGSNHNETLVNALNL